MIRHSDGRLAVVFQNRYNEASQFIRQSIVDGRYGKLLSMRAAVNWHRTPEYYTESGWRGFYKTEGGGVSSRAGFDGLARKELIILIVLMATLLDRAIGSDGAIFQTAACGYYIANEGISILENSALLGVPYPKAVMNALEALREKGDE